MPVGNDAAAIAAEIEFIRPELENLVLSSSVFWKELKKNTSVQAVSNRPARVPYMIQGAARVRQANLDGGGMGRGAGPQETPGYVSCVPIIQATEYTALAEYATNSDQKAIKAYVALTMTQASETMAGALDSLGANSDGSNTFDTVVSTGATSIVVNNPNAFQDGQKITVYPTAFGGAARGTVEIKSVNALSSTLQLTGAPPGGTIAGDLLVLEGSAGAANTGIVGIPGYAAPGDTGNYMGISKAAWSGKLSTPAIDLAGGALVPSIVRALQMKQILALGNENDGADNVAHCNVDVVAAWERNYLNVQRIVTNQVSGDTATDMLKPKPVREIAGRRVLMNVRATPGRLDLLAMKYWSRIETIGLDFYAVGSQTLFPAYDADGGIATSILTYMRIMWQMLNVQPRRGGLLYNIAIPANIFA